MLLQVLTYNAERRAVFKKNVGKKVELNKLNNGYSIKDPHGRKGQMYEGNKEIKEDFTVVMTHFL